MPSAEIERVNAMLLLGTRLPYNVLLPFSARLSHNKSAAKVKVKVRLHSPAAVAKLGRRVHHACTARHWHPMERPVLNSQRRISLVEMHQGVSNQGAGNFTNQNYPNSMRPPDGAAGSIT